MSATTRQYNLLVQQDWTKIYQTFQNADFESYDFETLRQSMINYLRNYYPEDFNDYLESSEYVALLDLMSFMGQSLAFRTDLNARENFLDTAQRRDSVLKLARMVSYNPKRNQNASGFLKFDYVSTTENIYDSTGLNLSGIPIFWNDPNNRNWLEQFALVINSALINSQMVGRPGNTAMIFGVQTEEYTINLLPRSTPVFPYTETVEGIKMDFELVNPTSSGKSYIYELPPKPTSQFTILYKNDNLGNNSTQTGWFAYFKQGSYGSVNFTLADSLPNRVVNINVNNINNDDVWLFKLDSNGNPSVQWTVVNTINGHNVIYNSATVRTLVQVNTRANDQIDLVFGDGSFADIPIGSFVLYYRTSNGLSYNINAGEMQGVTATVNYVSRSGAIQTFTFKASLHDNVNNSSPRESLDSIKTNAPQSYYLQNRMITGEDYNTLPFTKFTNILKIKATNRSSSGISRYLDVIDVTGKYSATNVFCSDGVLWKKETIPVKQYNVPANGDITSSLNNLINNIIIGSNLVAFKQFAYLYFSRFNTLDLALNGTAFVAQWNQMTINTNQSTGYFATNPNLMVAFNSSRLTGVTTYAQPLLVGASSSTAMGYVVPGAIIRFRATDSSTLQNVNGWYFDSNNQMFEPSSSRPLRTGDQQYLYASVISVAGDGTNGGIISAGQTGPIALSVFVPTGAIVDQVIPGFQSTVPTSIFTLSATLINSNKNFGIRFDQTTQSYKIIQPQDLSLTQTNSTIVTTNPVNAMYSSSYAGDTSATGLDSSWLIAFVNTLQGYNVYYRQLSYVFASEAETTFYFDPQLRVYDSKTATTITDQIVVLQTNTDPYTSLPLYTDKIWFINNMITDPDGYNSVNKVQLQYSDVSRSGTPDNPDIFSQLVLPGNNVYFQEIFSVTNSYSQYQILPAGTVVDAYPSQAAIVGVYSQYSNGQVFFAYNENTFYQLVVTVTPSNTVRSLTAYANGKNYLWYPGRQNIYFRYLHAAPDNHRIDPSPNNIMDLYIMTTEYVTAYQAWIRDTTGTVTQPQAPTTDQLQIAYAELEKYKAMSDTIIYSSGKFKPLFGDKADPLLQATFKVVKNSNIVVSDNDIKSSVIAAIDKFFDISNWDFGETFYFSELSAYLHQVLAPNVSSIIIVPNSTDQQFGNLYQINAQPNEIMISAATTKNVQIISTITAADLV
jgi:hypothetical protein